MKYILTLTFLMTSLLFAKDLNQKALEEWKAGKAVIVDVREKEEIEEGMVKGALWFPLTKINSDKIELEKIKAKSTNKTIYLYCRSGKRASKVQVLLKEEGVKSVNLGGFNELKKTFPTTK